MKQHWCSECKTLKPATELTMRRTDDTLFYVCKVHVEKQRARAYMAQYFERNHERMLQTFTQWRADNPDYQKQYREANREKRRAYNAKYTALAKNQRACRHY